MLRVFVDSGSSIKQNEKDIYNVDIIPLKINLGGKEYDDGVDIDNEIFYDFLINSKGFPKTSLPSMSFVEEKVNKYLKQGDQVLILPISSGISGTYNSIRLLFDGNPNVRVIDTKTAIGGIRYLVEEVNKMRDKSLDEITEALERLIPKIVVMAIPETLEYLYKGGRLSKAKYFIGSILHINPIVGIENGSVVMFSKKHGIKGAMKYIISQLEERNCDTNYPIIPSYTYNKSNVDDLINMTPKKYTENIKVYDDIDYAIAAHWGPNSFGYIFVSK